MRAPSLIDSIYCNLLENLVYMPEGTQIIWYSISTFWRTTHHLVFN